MNVDRAEAFIVAELRARLSPTLTYHGLHHTLDVAEQAQALAAAEGISDADSLGILRTAALFHDAGFLTTYQGHEAAACELARQVLPGFEYAAAQIAQVCECIMATQIPQTAPTHLAAILCDADLDYLGRADFYPISASLLAELEAHNMLRGQRAWDEVQVKFLGAHRYLTATNRARREPGKQARLTEIRAALAAT